MIEKRDVPCNLCGANDHDFLFDAEDRLHGCEGTFTYVQCKRCGLVYMNPQISPGDAGDFYPANYGPHRIVPEKRQSGKHVFKSKSHKRSFVTSICGKLKQDARLLDIGCGNGSFLNEIRTLTGCQAYGVDSSKLAAKAAGENYGLDVFTGTILESPFPNHHFDVITAWAYLEHVNNPLEVLQKISNLLKRSGSCIISIPNFKSFNARLFKEKWYHLDCPRHLYIYSPDTIKKLSDKAGLSVAAIAFDKSAGGLLRSLRYRFGDDTIPFKQRKRLRGSSLLKKLLLPLTTLLALIKQADMMVICVRRSKNA